MSVTAPVTGSADFTVTGLPQAVLREIAELLDRLINTGEEAVIDLRSLPMTDRDRESLRARLGAGEIRAELEVSGRSTVEETGIFGVWWVRHEGAGGGVAGEQIVVARVPAIFITHADDLARGRDRLRDLLATDEFPLPQEALQ